VLQERPSRWLLMQYGLLAFPLAFAGLPLYIHAPDFYTRHLGLGLGSIGVILLLVRLFDAVQDPVIGYLSDRYPANRFTILASGIMVLTFGLFALFFGPPSSISTSFWFAGSMLLATTGFSVVMINMNLIGGFWVDDKNQRTRIATWRESFSLLGLLVASILPTVLFGITGATQAFKWLFFIYVLCMFPAYLLFKRFLNQVDLRHLSVTKRQVSSKAEVDISISGVISPSRILDNPFFQILHDQQRLFFLTYLLSQIAASLPAVLVLFFIRDYLNAESYTGFFLFLYFVSGATLMQVWFLLSKKLDKYRAWLLSMVLSIIVFIWVVMIKPGDVFSYSAICILSGLALGADLALPASIIADRINARKAESRATQYYGVMAFIPKLALALASGFAFFILDNSGFVVAAQNSQAALQSLLLLYGLVPCLIKLLAAISLWMLIKTQGENDEYNQKRSTYYGANDIS
jgi:glycoside/pentoside/hexuronide:cation symporter, GPH family